MLSSQQISKAGTTKCRHKLEAIIKAEEGNCQHRDFYEERMTAIEQIRDDKRQNRCKEVAARSFEKEILERNNKHRSSKTTPENATLKEHQHAKKGYNCIEHEAGGREQKSTCRRCYYTP